MSHEIRSNTNYLNYNQFNDLMKKYGYFVLLIGEVHTDYNGRAGSVVQHTATLFYNTPISIRNLHHPVISK